MLQILQKPKLLQLIHWGGVIGKKQTLLRLRVKQCTFVEVLAKETTKTLERLAEEFYIYWMTILDFQKKLNIRRDHSGGLVFGHKSSIFRAMPIAWYCQLQKTLRRPGLILDKIVSDQKVFCQTKVFGPKKFNIHGKSYCMILPTPKANKMPLNLVLPS